MRLIRTAVILVACWASLSSAQQNVSEEQVKAAFIYNFAKFVTWPERTQSAPADDFEICVLDQDNLKSELERAVEGKRVQGQQIRVSDGACLDYANLPQIVFIPASVEITAEELTRLHTASVLTVGESRDFQRRGGIIRFYLNKSKVHFEINPAAAQTAELEISSKLMRVARIIDDE